MCTNPDGYFSPHHSFLDYHLPDFYIKHVNDAYFSKQPVVFNDRKLVL